MSGKWTQTSLSVLLMVRVAVLAAGTTNASTIRERVEAVGQQLHDEQRRRGHCAGSWPGEETCTGSIVAGLADAYGLTRTDILKTTALAGANYILFISAGNFYGDEAYALWSLSQMSLDNDDTPWQSLLSDFYMRVQYRPAGGTVGYMSLFEKMEPSTAVFYVAHHTADVRIADLEFLADTWRAVGDPAR